jgi:hypothetical protein
MSDPKDAKTPPVDSKSGVDRPDFLKLGAAATVGFLARGEILIPGALGYTLGRYQRRRTGNDGRPMVQHGTYFTLWRKQPGGSWKIAADTGQPDGPFQPAE